MSRLSSTNAFAAPQMVVELEEHTFQCRTCGFEHTRCCGTDGFRICGGRSITLTRIELDAIIRALQFEADAMTAEARSFEVSDGHRRWLSPKQIEC